MAAQVRAVQAAISAWFASREPREKTLLIAGAALVLAALVYNVLWVPAYDGRAQIAASLPEHEAQLAEVRQQADEARRLKAAAAVHAPTGAALRDALAASLAEAGLAAAQLSVLGEGVQIDVKTRPFDAWMSWLDTVRRADRVRVVSAHASAESQAGRATVSATLQPASDS